MIEIAERVLEEAIECALLQAGPDACPGSRRGSFSTCSPTTRNGLGDRASTCIDPRMQVVEGKGVCVVTCQRSPEPVYLTWKDLESDAAGCLYVRSGPGTVRLSRDDSVQYVATRFAAPTT